MDFDVARVLGLVTRSVRNFEKDGKAGKRGDADTALRHRASMISGTR